MSLLARLLAALVIWRRVLRRPRSPVGLPSPPEEIDPSSREVPSNRRMETIVAILFCLAGFCGLAFLVLYVVEDDTQLLGVSAGLGLLFVALGMMLMSMRVVPQVQHVESRPEYDEVEEQEEVAEQLRSGVEGVSRRKLLTAAGGAAAAGVGVVVVVPIASLGPQPGVRIGQSPWQRGRRVVDEDGKPISADDINEGGFLTGFPEGASLSELGSAIIIARLPVTAYHLPAERRDWVPEGICAYSKICTHAGCAISMYRSPLDQSTAGVSRAFVCPCHYSTFDPASGAQVVFGPAGRPLPQLPLMIDEHRVLRAAGDMSNTIGPAWWGTAHA